MFENRRMESVKIVLRKGEVNLRYIVSTYISKYVNSKLHPLYTPSVC
jgi:hypothetical protein